LPLLALGIALIVNTQRNKRYAC